MKGFTLELPTKIYFGNNNVEEALKKENKWLTGNVMIVTTGRSLIKFGYLNELKNILDNLPNVEETIIFDNISANPKLEEINEAVKIGMDRRVKAIIGFGGGSAIDAAKTTAVGLGTFEKLERFFIGGNRTYREYAAHNSHTDYCRQWKRIEQGCNYIQSDSSYERRNKRNYGIAESGNCKSCIHMDHAPWYYDGNRI
uniref:iron-containing alcohol dehydrogenase n=1 Tax=Clostridium sp. NkU-1 TaxID=1095009 RepID=UPI0006D0B741